MSHAPSESRPSIVGSAIQACRSAFLNVGLFSMVINLLMLTGPLFMLQVYDRVLTSHSVPTLVALAVLVLVLYAFYGILELVRHRLLVRIGTHVDEALSEPTFDAAVSNETRSGSSITSTMPVRDMEQLRHYLASPGPSAIFDLPWMPIYLLVIFLLHPVLGVFATLAATFLVGLAVVNEFLSSKPASETAHRGAKVAMSLEQARRNSEVVTTMGLRPALRRGWSNDRQQYRAVLQQAGDRSSIFSALTKSSRFSFQSLILALGAYLALQQELTPGAMIAASILMTRALAPVDQAIAHWRGFVSARQGYSRLKNELPALQAPAPETVLPVPSRELAVEGLIIKPTGLDAPILQNVGFKLTAGEILGVIGPSGSGKSTLARALVNVVQPIRGKVQLDGAALDQWSEAELGHHIGYLPQDVELFDGTVAQNICRFIPDAESDDIVTAAKQVGAHELIIGLPQGYDTQIGRAGSLLSAGQRQRIGLARAIFGSPFLVVLDEPNSNLDNDGEQALISALQAMRTRKMIVVVIAHRPNAIAQAQKILVVTNGLQTAFGPKEQVLPQVLKPVATAAQPTKRMQNG